MQPPSTVLRRRARSPCHRYQPSAEGIRGPKDIGDCNSSGPGEYGPQRLPLPLPCDRYLRCSVWKTDAGGIAHCGVSGRAEFTCGGSVQRFATFPTLSAVVAAPETAPELLNEAVAAAAAAAVNNALHFRRRWRPRLRSGVPVPLCGGIDERQGGKLPKGWQVPLEINSALPAAYIAVCSATGVDFHTEQRTNQ